MKPSHLNPIHLAMGQDEQLRRSVEIRLYDFVRLFWETLEPGVPFEDSWHLRLLCEYLELVADGKLTRLLVNMPPRHGKSLVTSVFFPVWEWIRTPELRYLFVSHSEILAIKHSLDRRRLIESPLFQRYWGHRVRLTREQRAKGEFHNTRRGVMIATSILGSVTGKGGNRIIIDDPHSPAQADSDYHRERVLELYQNTFPTRLSNQRTDAIIVVMQRLHTRDLSAVCLEQGYTHVCLPALEEQPTNVTFPKSGRVYRRLADEPLWSAREGHAELSRLRRHMGSIAFAGQYLQRPLPREGGLFNPLWWRYQLDLPAIDEFDDIWQAWDLSFKDAPGSDYVVGIVFGRIGQHVYLLDRVKARLSFTATCTAMLALTARYPRTKVVLVESAANGPAIIDVLSKRLSGLTAVPAHDGKFARARACEPILEAGQVFLPQPRLADGTPIRGREWVADFVQVCESFPKGAHDDDVDAFCHGILWHLGHPYLEPAGMFQLPDPTFLDQLLERRRRWRPW